MAVAPVAPERWLEKLERRGFRCREMHLRGSPNKKHWHIRPAVGSGTLDATFDPAVGELLLELRPNRAGRWTEEQLQEVVEAASSTEH